MAGTLEMQLRLIGSARFPWCLLIAGCFTLPAITCFFRGMACSAN